jgi:hypothetical protein
MGDDAERRSRAKVPDDVPFKTKPQLAVDILTGLHTAGLLPPWAAGDEVYGRDKGLRDFCEHHAVGYVLGVPCSFTVVLTSGRRVRADQALKLVPPKAWNRASCGAGSKGDRLYGWAWIATASDHHHLLVRRNLSDPTDVAFFSCHVPADRPATLPTLVAVAGRRWPVEEDLCATRRLVVSPTQLGGTRREVPGSGWLTRRRKVKGTRACQKTSDRVQAYEAMRWETRVIWRKLNCLQPNPQETQLSRPPERRLKPVPRPATVMKFSRRNLRDAERCPTRVFKGMNGPPTSRSDVQQGRTWDRLRDASPMATEFP